MSMCVKCHQCEYQDKDSPGQWFCGCNDTELQVQKTTERLDKIEEQLKNNLPMATVDKETVSDKIANDILSDLSSRRGFRDTWDMLDESIQEEIQFAWSEIIKANL